MVTGGVVVGGIVVVGGGVVVGGEVVVGGGVVVGGTVLVVMGTDIDDEEKTTGEVVVTSATDVVDATTEVGCTKADDVKTETDDVTTGTIPVDIVVSVITMEADELETASSIEDVSANILLLETMMISVDNSGKGLLPLAMKVGSVNAVLVAGTDTSVVDCVDRITIVAVGKTCMLLAAVNVVVKVDVDTSG